jgi:hypothetical protein
MLPVTTAEIEYSRRSLVCHDGTDKSRAHEKPGISRQITIGLSKERPNLGVAVAVVDGFVQRIAP